MMTVRVGVLVGLTIVLAGAALAEAPNTSLRPQPRPVAATTAPAPVTAPVTAPVGALAPGAEVTADAPGGLALIRPRPRPEIVLATAAHQAAPVAQPVAAAAAAPKGLFGFLRPNKRPDGLVAKQAAAVRTLPGKQAVVSKKGSVCGIPDIKGETLAPITAKTRGCGIENPVRVTSVAGVRLSNAATINCDTAKALRQWITQAVEPTYGKGKIVEVKVAASYACRSRNNQRGAKVSEHARGNAIDIAGFTFSNGKSVSVLRNYDKTMRKVHKAACGTFGTTLGPGSDGFHEDHLHFDIARYRGGPYCR
ncbi:extensin-like domain-containing protein [Pseudotabrizicola sp. L79]|uniref:extensin-like domain-containing protein n=1 Tax=Pseudotabrizicola sp. L79 TaxID=3118402 RepID=UPI002F92A332